MLWEQPDWRPDAGIERDFEFQKVAEVGRCTFTEAEAMFYDNPHRFRRLRDLSNLRDHFTPLAQKVAMEEARKESEHEKAASATW